MNRLRTLLLSPFLAGLVLAPAALAQKGDAVQDAGRSAFYGGLPFRELLEQHGSGWRVDWCPATGTPRAIHGRGIDLHDWRENSLAEARRHALRQLQERADLLGLGTSEFREAIGARMGRTWSFVFDQYFRGLPCIGGRADVRVSMAGRVAMLGSSAWQLGPDVSVTPTLTSETAQAIAVEAMQRDTRVPAGVRSTVGTPRLVIWGDVHAALLQTPRLAWEVPVRTLGDSGRGLAGRCYVDAANGSSLHFASDKHECGAHCTHGTDPAPAALADVTAPPPSAPPVPTTVTVMGWTRTGLDSAAGTTNVPLPGLEIAVPGHGVAVTDANGQFTVDLVAPVVIGIDRLKGRYHDTIWGAEPPNQQSIVLPGVATTIQLLTAGANTDASSHTTLGYWTDRVHAFTRGVLGDSPQLDVIADIHCEVNYGLACNAYYLFNSMVFYRAGGGCQNMATPTVIAHEWGHGLDDRYGGISQTNGLSEGWGDIVSMYLTDDPVVGLNVFGPGTNVRTGTNTLQFPNGAHVHEQGQSWGGFAWKLRERLALTRGRSTAIAVSNEIVLGSIVANAGGQAAATLEVFLADDNDGDLTNGTPHAAELIWACAQHSLPVPAPAGLANDECAYPFELTNGVNGPFTSTGASSSASAMMCGQAANDVWFVYPVGAAGTLDVRTCGHAGWDTVLAIYSGSCGSLALLGCNDDDCASYQSRVAISVQPGLYYVRVAGYQGATGDFGLEVSGPLGTRGGTRETFGVACGAGSRSFYEPFGPGGFDLSDTSMRMVRSNNHYVVGSGGTFIAPTAAATTLGLQDDDRATITLPAPFPYVGGSTPVLTVFSNGFVGVDALHNASGGPNVSNWLASPTPRWGTLHDFDPSAPGGGRVKHENTGSLVVVTWDGVRTFSTTSANTLQLQFDTATGDVTFVWLAVTDTTRDMLVGFAAGGPSVDLGARDLLSEVPAGFATISGEAIAPGLSSGLPRLGLTLALTSTFPTPTPLGLLLLGLNRLDPGTPLDGLGLPGCRAHTSAEAVIVQLPVGGQAIHLLPIPFDPGMIGLPLIGQVAAVSPASNAVGLSFSRALALTVGL
jgi:hypothetical protein